MSLAIKAALASVSIIMGVVLVVLSILVFPNYLVRRDLKDKTERLSPTDLVKAQNDIRATLLQGLGGLILLAGAAATWRQVRISREQMNRTYQYNLQHLSHLNRGQVTERYTRSVEQLGSDKNEIRIGGIYALEQIAHDEERYRRPIIEVLTAYVRGHAPKSHVEEDRETDSGEGEDLSGPANYMVRVREVPDLSKRAPDLQAVLTVLGRRTFLLEPVESWDVLNLNGVDLAHANLGRANLRGVDLASTDLSMSFFGEATLDESHLNFADFRGASFVNAYVRDCNMHAVDLRYSYLVNADLSNSFLQGARLNNANLEGTNLEKCYLHGADFQGANPEKAKLAGARADTETLWPEGFRPEAAGIIIQGDEFEDLDEQGAR